MKNFEYYFENAVQDFGMALFYAAMLIILITLIVRAYKKDQEVYGFLSDVLKRRPKEVEKLDPNVNGSTKVSKTLRTAIRPLKASLYTGQTHVEA